MTDVARMALAELICIYEDGDSGRDDSICYCIDRLLEELEKVDSEENLTEHRTRYQELKEYNDQD